MLTKIYSFIALLMLLALVVIIPCSCNKKTKMDILSADSSSIKAQPIIVDSISNDLKLNPDWFYKQDMEKYKPIVQSVLNNYITKNHNKSDSIYYIHYLNYYCTDKYKRLSLDIAYTYEFAVQTRNETGIKDMSIYDYMFEEIVDKKIKESFFITINGDTKLLVIKSMFLPEEDEACIVIFSKNGLFRKYRIWNRMSMKYSNSAIETIKYT